MTKRKANTSSHLEKESEDVYNQNIMEAPMSDYVKQIMMLYGINVSVFRALTAILDGLTPVMRRTLITAYRLGATADKPMIKANELIGPVQALHPHGEMSVTKSFSNEIKYWENNAPLFETYGNCGSLTGERCAASRYLDTRLSKFAMDCFFSEYDEDIIDMTKSNTRKTEEPVVIPTKYPYFLLSSNTGIAWGNSSSIPPFNLEEVFRLTQALIKNPNMENVYLYPDSPRGYSIIETPDIANICACGRGTIKIQAVINYHEEDGKKWLSVKGFPEETYMDDIMQDIALLIKKKELPGVKTLADNTVLANVSFSVILTDDADPDFIIDTLYRKTKLRSFVSIDMNFAGRTTLQPMGMKDALLFWIANRIDMKQKYLMKKMSKAEARIHALEALIELLSTKENADKAVSIIRTSESSEESIERLMKEFDISSLQASIIDSTPLNSLRQDNQNKFLQEMNKLREEIKENEDIASSEEKTKEVICKELEEGIVKYGKPRACSIISADALESPIHHYSVVVTKKYIKKMSVNTTIVGQIDSDDEVIGMWSDVPEDATLRIFDSAGRCYCIGLDKISPTDAVSKGIPLSTFSLVGVPIRGFFDNMIEDYSEYSIVFFTNGGFVKRTSLSQYTRSRMSLQAINLNKGDSVCFVTIVKNDEVPDESSNTFPLVYTTNGSAISVDVMSIEMTDRLTKGSRYLSVEEGDSIQGICEVSSTDSVMVVTSKGYVKVCEMDDIFKTTKRRAAMIKVAGLHDGDTVFRIIPVTKELKKIICYLQTGEKCEVHLKDAPRTTRIAKGTKLVPVKRGDGIVRIKIV